MDTQAQYNAYAQGSQIHERVRHDLKAAAPTCISPLIDHWVLQLWGIPPEQIDHTERLQNLLRKAVCDLRLTQVSAHSHYFGPGVSVVIILSESHLSAHTWPEMGYMHVDIVTCVKKLSAARLENVFQQGFSSEYTQVAQLDY